MCVCGISVIMGAADAAGGEVGEASCGDGGSSCACVGCDGGAGTIDGDGRGGVGSGGRGVAAGGGPYCAGGNPRLLRSASAALSYFSALCSSRLSRPAARSSAAARSMASSRSAILVDMASARCSSISRRRSSVGGVAAEGAAADGAATPTGASALARALRGRMERGPSEEGAAVAALTCGVRGRSASRPGRRRWRRCWRERCMAAMAASCSSPTLMSRCVAWRASSKACRRFVDESSTSMSVRCCARRA